MDSSGELGDGTTTLRTSPVPVAGTRKWRALSAGYRHTCGVTMADVALCWGYNGDGALGDGTLTNRSRPVRVAGGRLYVQVRPGGNHTCAWTRTGEHLLLGSER